MSFDLDALRAAVLRHGRVSRVVIAATHGSVPREVGAAMLVWQGGQSGTVGGGTLEYELAGAARAQEQPTRLSRHALGPDMGQCCGGAVEVVSEVYDAARVAGLERRDVIARPVTGGDAPPLAVRRMLARARDRGALPAPTLVEGWMVEPVHPHAAPLWIWGAGHVGRALAATFAPLPDFRVTWADTGAARFPAVVPDDVTVWPAPNLPALVVHAPRDAHHLIVTYSHELDLALCHALLRHEFVTCGLIGSATKWARFRKRLVALGHAPAEIARIDCPIGDPNLGKHPQAIAVGTATALLKKRQAPAARHQGTTA
ncbi:xdhC and CoxI family protein [Roseovarius sp. A-2]|uniref:xanthine dehydrogenase accessory protein XdhC n=1 Tax=Roseovarius sp. A-2 TaxID=1570360 RepID=UPI0009B54F8B|nr:xanthine dehydrogenase accessory protein XdhC [Roseovarius sp. A-2]GAW35204.1 xdhC and CoxI family protein [Roseovarius sp. A-2]